MAKNAITIRMGAAYNDVTIMNGLGYLGVRIPLRRDTMPVVSDIVKRVRKVNSHNRAHELDPLINAYRAFVKGRIIPDCNEVVFA